MNADVWCKAILDQAKSEVGATGAQLVLLNRQSTSLIQKYGDIDQNICSQLEADLKRAIYDNELKHKRLDGDTYQLFPIPTRVGCIGVLVLQTTPGAEGLHMENEDETNAREAASIIGKVMLDELFDKLGPVGQNDHLNHDTSEMILPYGNHDCVVVFVNLRSLSRLLGSANGQPEVYEMIEAFNSAISNQAKRHYGVVNKYIGAGALLLFNLTIDDVAINDYRNIAALRALCAASVIQERFQEIERKYRETIFEIMPEREIREEFINIDIGVGMNAEQPYLYPMGTAERYDYSCFGSGVSLAKSIESIAGRQQVPDVDWNKPGYCSIMFTDTIEAQLRNLADSQRFGDEIKITFVDGPSNITFDRFPHSYDLQTFEKIRIREPDIEPKLPERIRNRTIHHTPQTDSINGNDYERWEIQIE